MLSSAYTALGLTTSIGELRSQFVPVADLSDTEVEEFLRSKFPNVSKGTIDHIFERVGNRILNLQEVTVITEALTQKNPTERDLLVITDRYADQKEIEHTGALNFFLENFAKIPRPQLFKMVLENKEVGLKEFSQAFKITMKKMVQVLQEAPHPFHIDPETLVVTVGSHFMAKSIRQKIGLKDQ